jgi:hypothetical protein
MPRRRKQHKLAVSGDSWMPMRLGRNSLGPAANVESTVESQRGVSTFRVARWGGRFGELPDDHVPRIHDGGEGEQWGQSRRAAPCARTQS